MADKLHLRLANHTDVANDDPFAELTRIMGFDPRSAARPAEEPAAPQPGPIPAPQDAFDELDFSIDLEKELLGDFADDEVARQDFAVGEWEAPRPEAGRVEPDFEPAAFEAAAPLAAAEPLFDPLEEATVQKGWPEEASRGAGESEFDDLDVEMEQAFDFGSFEVEQPSAIPLAANDIPQPIEHVEPAFEADPFAALNFDDGLPAEPIGASLSQPTMHDIGDHTSELYSVDSLDFDASQQAIDLDRQFDASFEGVDFNLDAADEHVGEPALAAASPDDLDRDLDLSFDDSFASAMPAVEPVAAAEPELSLEDELNALLGNAPPLRRAPVWAEPPAVHAPRPAPIAADPQPEIFARDHGHHAVAAAVEPYVPVDYAPEQMADFMQGPSPDFADDHPGAASTAGNAEPDFSLDFDDADFDAALSTSAAVDGREALYDDEPAMASPEPRMHEPESRDEQPAPDTIDPYAALAALSATLKPSRSFAGDGTAQYTAPAETAHPAAAATHHDATLPYADEDGSLYPGEATSDAYVPDIDTYDVPEHAVALADDLDLPEFAYEDEPAPAPRYDDIDAEFTSLLNGMNSADVPGPAPAAFSVQEERIDLTRPIADRDQPTILAGVPYPAPTMPAAAAQPRAVDRGWNGTSGQGADDFYSDMRSPAPAAVSADPDLADMEFAYDPDLDEDIALPAYAPIEQRKPPRRGLMVAAVVGGVALLGGVGALALSWGDGTGSVGPVLVKADDQPVKIKPENPGGTTIPNQDNKVYDTVVGGSVAVDPKQDTLVSTEEEPVDIPPPMDETAGELEADATTDAAAVPPSQKAEDRVDQAEQDAGVDNSVEVAAVAPRKVRTMIVKADGTLVAREEPAPAPEQSAADSNAVMTAPVPSAIPTTGTVAADESTDIANAPPAEDALPIATAPVDAPALAPASEPAEAAAPASAEPEAQQSSVTPQKAPVAPARPADQPVNVVGEVKADKVAALSPAASAPAAAGAWAMQIASQPTEQAANASYQDLARRYGAILEGRQVNVVKAEISGKGTFWRVRVAANSRNEAVSLCESYKSAGGNCFVSK